MTCGTKTEKEEMQRLYEGLAHEAQKQTSFSLRQHKKRVIVLAGPTGVGKSHFAMKLAQVIGGEIISADSIQVYRGMDIGTSKPSRADRQEVPHHLIDIRDVSESFNVVDFYYEARHCCQLILARESVPIVVGGSGFYLQALMYGPPSGPPSVPELRKMLEEQIEREGSDILFERLRKLDPDYAGTITKKDKQKIVRGLEIITLTGKKVSKLSWAARIKPLNYDFRCWFLHRPREDLYHRIERRCEDMVEIGLVNEVEQLIPQGLRDNSSAANAIGYRQALDYLDSTRSPEGHVHFLREFKQASRNYAKRQLTWFRKKPVFRWLNLGLHDYELAEAKIVEDFRAQ